MDNVAGNKELQELLAKDKLESISEKRITVNHPDIEWHFSHPYAPHTNGAVERMVGLVKRGLEAVLCCTKVRSLNDELFQTLAVRVEGILNSRPLTYVSNDSSEPLPITPNDFLMPATSREIPAIPEDDNSKMRQKLKRIDEHLTQVWN